MATPFPDSPFAPARPTPAQLQAYAEGRLPPAEHNAVERALESDPLLRDALEGLQHPQATTGWSALQRQRPGAGGRASLWVGGSVLLAALAIALWPSAVPRPNNAPTTPTSVAQPDAAPTEIIEEGPLAIAEISQARELPATEQIGHRSDERHAAPVDRSTDVQPLADRRPDTAQLITPASAAAPARAARAVHQLLYLHDLKVVHPRALYAREPLLEVEPGGVDARFADHDQQRQAQGSEQHMLYTAYLDEAMAHFARTHHKEALAELRFLLTQYPDDVNALFYAGLCAYNLGLYDRARSFLHRVATHPVDAFDEEATWYHALTLQRAGEPQAAQEAFARIAAGGGFYAERAAEMGEGGR
jgi:TolA-binding protein